MMQKVLYIDDESSNLITLQVGLRKFYNVFTLENPKEALELIEREDIKVVITDQRMPGITGLELASQIQVKFPGVIIIILTAYGDNDTMLEAINQGGIFRYLLKPWDIKDLTQTLSNAFETYELRRKNITLINDLIVQNHKLQSAYNEIAALKQNLEEENIQLKDEFLVQSFSSKIIGQSKALQYVLRQLEQVAKTNTSILLLGETGTGKELFARTAHALSSRKDKIMVTINCAAIPESLIESELFGHEKGAFTGAHKLKYGKFEVAHQGTLFLDEIGELPLAMQPKLLRVLQENEFERLGGTAIVKADFRLIAATNRNLQQEIEKGYFRSDLFYRLNILPINIPPLREHKEDIPQLVEFFLGNFNRKSGKTIGLIPKRTLDKLLEYHWPGNIRELENIIERAHVLSPGNKLEMGDWFEPQKSSIAEPTGISSLEENEKQHIMSALRYTRWKVRGENGAAELLQINPSTLESRMKKLGIERPV
jgi:formate hydrogenlyase transcriptional activator